MGNLLSPGVKVTDKDLSQVVSAEGASTTVFAGDFEKGPIGAFVSIDNVNTLKDVLGYPNKKNYNDWYQCYNFLQYSNKLLVSRAANLNGDLKKTELKFVSDKHKLADVKSEQITVSFVKQSTTDLYFDKTEVFSVGDKISFMENPQIYTVRLVRHDKENIVTTGVTPTVTSGTEDQDVEESVDTVTTTQVQKDVTIITLDVSPDLVNDSTTYFYKITEAEQPQGNKISFKGNNVLKAGDIFGLSDVQTDPQFRVLEVSQGTLNGELYTNIIYEGKDDPDEIVNAQEDQPVYILERTQSACVEIPSTNEEYDPKKYDNVEHTVANYFIFDDLKESLRFVNNTAKVKFFAKTPGKWGNGIDIAIANSDDFNKGKEILPGLSLDGRLEYLPYNKQFVVFVIYKNEIVENFLVSFDETEKDDFNQSMFIENVINTKSDLVRVMVNNANEINTIKTCLNDSIAKLSNGGDSEAGIDDIIDAYKVFENKEEIEVDQIIANEKYPKAATDLAILREDCIAFVGSPRSSCVGLKSSEATRKNVEFRKELNVNSKYVSLFSNYKYQYSSELNKLIWVNLAADVAGLKAQTNFNQDLWYAAAGLNRGLLKNVSKLAISFNNAQRDDLYVNGVNPITTFPNQGSVVYGQKTLLTKQSSFNRINVVALFNHLARSLGKMAKYSLFEFNDSFTRNYIISLIKPFLASIKSGRGIQDYIVICDETNNTPYVVANNQMVIDIYIKPTYVAEFIHLNFINVGTNDFSIAISG